MFRLPAQLERFALLALTLVIPVATARPAFSACVGFALLSGCAHARRSEAYDVGDYDDSKGSSSRSSTNSHDTEGPTQIALLDGRKVEATTVQVVELIPLASGQFVFVLGSPVPIEPPIALQLAPKREGAEPSCAAMATAVTRVGPGHAGAEAYEYAIEPDATCQLRRGQRYRAQWSGGGDATLRAGDEPNRLRRE